MTEATLDVVTIGNAIVDVLSHEDDAVVEKLGLREEGLALRFLQIRGVYEDHVRYAMTVDAWEQRRNEVTAGFLTAPASAPTPAEPNVS